MFIGPWRHVSEPELIWADVMRPLPERAARVKTTARVWSAHQALLVWEEQLRDLSARSNISHAARVTPHRTDPLRGFHFSSRPDVS